MGICGGYGILVKAFWVIILIFAILFLVKLFFGKSSKNPSALEILQQRYAKGEISQEEYERKKKDILAS